MTSGFEYDEPETFEPATPSLDDPADAAMAMVNYGPETGEVSQEEESPSLDDTAEVPEPSEYSDEEYAELCRQAEEDYELEIQRLENQYASASVERAKQQDTLKHMKNAEKELLEEIRELRLQGPDFPSRVKPGQASPSLDDDSQEHATSSLLDVSEPEHAAYFAKSTREVLANIEGMGAKKLEGICELAPTVGDLERLRQKASLAGEPFKSELPKGVGTELASRIEDALVNALMVKAT